MNICEHLTVTANLFPDKQAIIFEGHAYSYARLDALSASASILLTESGVRSGDRVAIVLPNVPAFIVWYYAVLRIGGIAVSISSRLSATEIVTLVNDCQASALVALAETLETLGSQLPDCVRKKFAVSELGDNCDGLLLNERQMVAPLVHTEPGDAALILYTSGTTGFSKGATLSHANVRSNVHAFNHLCRMESHERMLLAVPLFHCFGQNALLNAAFNVGATLIMQRHFDPLEAKQLIQSEQITQLYGVPMMFELLYQCCDPASLASVAYCFSAAATLPIQTANRWREKFGLPIHEGYGLTETSPFAAYNHRLHFVPGSIGVPIDNVEMRIVDPVTESECPVGELGEIAIRGPNVMLGYWNRPAETAVAIRDGWFYSGDIGRKDERGYFFIVDRVKDMISVAGQKVYPAEVERVLLDNPQVAQIAVVGMPDHVFGEQVVAFVVAVEPSPNLADIIESLQRMAVQRLAAFKRPRDYIFLDDLPRNSSGKILKRELRDGDFSPTMSDLHAPDSATNGLELDAQPESSRNRQATSYTQSVPRLRSQLTNAYPANRKQIATEFVLGIVKNLTGSSEGIAGETRFLDAGLDSLMIVEMSSQIQVEIGPDIDIPATLVFDYPRIGDLSEFLLATICGPDEWSKQAIGGPPSKEASAPNRGAAITAAHLASVTDANKTAELKRVTSIESIEAMTEEQALEELLKELEA